MVAPMTFVVEPVDRHTSLVWCDAPCLQIVVAGEPPVFRMLAIPNAGVVDRRAIRLVYLLD